MEFSARKVSGQDMLWDGKRQLSGDCKQRFAKEVVQNAACLVHLSVEQVLLEFLHEREADSPAAAVEVLTDASQE